VTADAIRHIILMIGLQSRIKLQNDHSNDRISFADSFLVLRLAMLSNRMGTELYCHGVNDVTDHLDR
jgi:hypothetical protein